MSVDAGAARGSSLQLAAVGALVFSVLFLLHHVLQGSGPVGSSAAEVASYNVAHRGPLVGSEIALGLGLLAFIAFLAPLTMVIWRAGCETAAFALLVAGSVFLALGFMSVAAETALVDVAD